MMMMMMMMMIMMMMMMMMTIQWFDPQFFWDENPLKGCTSLVLKKKCG